MEGICNLEIHCDFSDVEAITLVDLFSGDITAASARPETLLYDYVDKASFLSAKDLYNTVLGKLI